MKLIAHAKDGLLNLYFAKLRSVLALLGVLVGTASVVAMVSGGELATQEALKQFKSLGTDLLAVSLNASSDEDKKLGGQSDNLTLSDALALKATDKQIVDVAPYTQLYNVISYNGAPVNGMLLGITDSFKRLVHVNMLQGRFISLLDGYQFYCVIGKNVYEAMKQISSKNPIGQPLQIGKHIFIIVGVADSWAENSFVYANIDNAVMVPLMASTLLSQYAYINNIILQLTPDADISRIESHVSTRLMNMLAGKQVSFRSAKELITKMRNQSDILTIFLALIGSISLFVGGIGVMNIMLVSVIERRREIGIRLAVGATRADIAALFLMEAIMLSLVGGFLGVLLGVLIAYFIALFSGWTFTIFLWPPLVGFSVSVAVGVFFGFYPAYLASKLNPIEALKSE